LSGASWLVASFYRALLHDGEGELASTIGDLSKTRDGQRLMVEQLSDLAVFWRIRERSPTSREAECVARSLVANSRFLRGHEGLMGPLRELLSIGMGVPENAVSMEIAPDTRYEVGYELQSRSILLGDPPTLDACESVARAACVLLQEGEFVSAMQALIVLSAAHSSMAGCRFRSVVDRFLLDADRLVADQLALIAGPRLSWEMFLYRHQREQDRAC